MTETRHFRTHVIAGDQPGPCLLITAGVHGDEFEPMAAVDRLARIVKPEALAGTLTLVPVANLSAFSRAARCGEDGLDLARTCPGDADGTVTQRVGAELSSLIRAATHYIDLHTGGIALSLMPLSGYTLHRDAKVLDAQREMARAFGLPFIWGTSASLEGRTLSVARDAGVPAMYVEHGGGAVFNIAAVDALAQGCMTVAKSLGMVSGTPDAPGAQTVVEDDRPSSGHLQVQNPAPIDGIFVAAVSLGARVTLGTALGEVRSLFSNECVTVHATSGGLVVMLRLVASVRAGDALAAIVDTGATS